MVHDDDGGDDGDDGDEDDADDDVVNADDEEGHRQARLALPRLALPPAENLAGLPESSSSNYSTDCDFPSHDHFSSNYVQKFNFLLLMIFSTFSEVKILISGFIDLLASCFHG